MTYVGQGDQIFILIAVVSDEREDFWGILFIGTKLFFVDRTELNIWRNSCSRRSTWDMTMVSYHERVESFAFHFTSAFSVVVVGLRDSL